MLSKEKYEKLNKEIILPNDYIPSYEELIAFYNEMKDISDNPIVKEEADDDIVNIVELYCLYFGMVSFSLLSSADVENFKERSMFCAMFSTIANSTLSIKYLAMKGLDYQANVVMRQLFEMCMLLLNVSIDKEKSEALINTENIEENSKIWRRYFTPSKLNETIEKYEGDFLTEWRKENYSWYSNYSHNDYLSFFLFSYSRPLTEEETLISNVWGGFVSRQNILLQNLASLLWYTTKAFAKIVSDLTTNFSKEKFVENEDFWNFAGYVLFLVDAYYQEYFYKKDSDA